MRIDWKLLKFPLLPRCYHWRMFVPNPPGFLLAGQASFFFFAYKSFHFTGAANTDSRASPRSSRSVSLSSISYSNNRTISALSRDQERLNTFLPDLETSVRDENSPTWPGISTDFSRLQDDSVDDVYQNLESHSSRDGAETRTVSPSRDSLVSASHDRVISPLRDDSVSRSLDRDNLPLRERQVHSPSPPPRTPSATSRLASVCTRSPSVHSREANEGRSPVSSASSLAANCQLERVFIATSEYEERKCAISPRAAVSRQSDISSEENRVESDTRTPSAKAIGKNPGTEPTRESEAGLYQMTDLIDQSQSMLEGIHEDQLTEEETYDQEFTGINDGARESEPEARNEIDGNDSIAKIRGN